MQCEWKVRIGGSRQRYSFASRRLSTNQASRYPPPPTCNAHTIAILVHDCCAIYDPPSDLICVCHTPYNIGNGNSMYLPQAEGVLLHAFNNRSHVCS